MRIITFSEYNEHSSPLFKLLNIIKIFDLVTFHIASFIMVIELSGVQFGLKSNA